VHGEKIALGEPFQIHGDAEMREEIQASLEFLATQHLLEAEDKANKMITKARAEAASVLAKANAQAKELLQQVQSQVDNIRDTAHEEGFKAGFQEGYADATEHVEQETTELLKEANTLLEGAYQAEKLVLNQFEKQALELIRHMVRRIVQREMTDAPEVLMAMVQQATESLYLSGKVQVVVGAQVIQNLRDYATRTRESLESMHRFEFIADPNLDPHQIYIIGQEGCFDLSPETQLRHLSAPLESQLTLPRPDPQSESTNTKAAAPEPAQESAPQAAPTDATIEPVPESTLELSEQPEAKIESTLGLDELLVDEPAPLTEMTDLLEADATPPEAPESQAMPYEFPALDDLATSPEAIDPPTEENTAEAPEPDAPVEGTD
jgi:flagellar assembly protein FliH